MFSQNWDLHLVECCAIYHKDMSLFLTPIVPLLIFFLNASDTSRQLSLPLWLHSIYRGLFFFEWGKQGVMTLKYREYLSPVLWPELLSNFSHGRDMVCALYLTYPNDLSSLFSHVSWQSLFWLVHGSRACKYKTSCTQKDGHIFSLFTDMYY